MTMTMTGIEIHKITKVHIMFDYIVFSFKTHIKEIGLSAGTGILGLITLTDVPTIITIIGMTLGTLLMPVYFGWRRYKKQEEREMESAVIKTIKDLRELGFITETHTIEEQRAMAIEWLSKPVHNI